MITFFHNCCYFYNVESRDLFSYSSPTTSMPTDDKWGCLGFVLQNPSGVFWNCVVILLTCNLKHIHHFCFHSLLFTVSCTATAGSSWSLGTASGLQHRGPHLSRFLPGGQGKPAPHLAAALSQRRPGGMSPLPAKCGQPSGDCWKVDDLAGWGLVFILSRAEGRERKKNTSWPVKNWRFVAVECWRMWTFPGSLHRVVALLIPPQVPPPDTHHWYVNAGQLVWQYHTVMVNELNRGCHSWVQQFVQRNRTKNGT